MKRLPRSETEKCQIKKSEKSKRGIRKLLTIIPMEPTLILPPFGYGCWQLGSKGAEDYWGLKFTDELADTLVPAAIQAGITYMDTAEGYNNGDSERQLSRSLAKLSPEEREKVIIGTKILPNNAGDVKNTINGMLERLQVTSLDLIMIHWPITKEGMAHFAGNHKTEDGGHDYSNSDMDAVGEIPSTQTCFRDLMELQMSGKIKHIGVSNFGVNQLKEALATGCKIAVNQICYNLIFRACEYDVLPFCLANNIQVLCYSVLMQGILTGRYATLEEIPEYRRRTRHFTSNKATNPKSRHGEDGHEEILLNTLVGLNEIAKEAGIPMSDMAQAWPLSNTGVSTCIVGGTKLEHIQGVKRASGLMLSEEVLKKIDAMTLELKNAMGSNMDLWQGMVEGKQTGRCN